MKRITLKAVVFIISILGVLCLCGCARKSERETVVPYENALFIYMCGSNVESRQGSATRNITELLNAEIPSNTTVIIQTGGSSKWRKYDIANDKISLYTVKNGELELLELQPNANMGDANTFYSFLSYCTEHYRADKMGVILWDHGGGSLNGVCNDENYRMDSLTLDEIDSAFSKLGERFEMIGFDACLMANVETADVVAQYADHMIASEELEPSGGWDYGAVVANFGTDAGYDKILSAYSDKCEENGKTLYTLSHIDMEKYAEVQKAFSVLADTLNSAEQLKDVVISAKNAMCFGVNGENEGYSNLIDLYGFAENMGSFACSQAVKSAVTCKNGADRQGAMGLSVYYPLMDVASVQTYLNNSNLNPAYRSFMESNYSDIPENLIEFTDRGSGRDGELHIELTEESQKYIQSVDYRLYRFVDGASEYEQQVFCMGEDSDVLPDGDNGYTTSFGGRWAAWNGEFIKCCAVDKTDNITIFTTPVMVNEEQGVIRFSYDIGKESFKVLGFLPSPNGNVVERLQSLNNGDQITLLYDNRTDSYEEILTEGASFEYDESQNIRLENFPDGYFQNYILITDIFGNTYKSNQLVCQWSKGKMSEIVITTDEDTENSEA